MDLLSETMERIVGTGRLPARRGSGNCLVVWPAVSSQMEVKSRWGREKRKGESESGCSLVLDLNG